MRETIQLRTVEGLSFTVDVAGRDGSPLVLLLHGFPESRHSWEHALSPIAETGFRAAAPDQRGYSPGARPSPAKLANYDYELLIADALSLADAAGAAGRPFHLVSHDWGGQVAWGLAARHPDRLASLTVLSRPHPLAFQRALRDSNCDQAHRSRHHRKFLEPETASLLLENDARRLRRMLADQGVPKIAIDAHLGVIGNLPALEAALAWYRANAKVIAQGTLYACRPCSFGATPTPRSGLKRRSPPGTMSKPNLKCAFCLASGIS